MPSTRKCFHLLLLFIYNCKKSCATVDLKFHNNWHFFYMIQSCEIQQKTTFLIPKQLYLLAAPEFNLISLNKFYFLF